jgi:hypothetical protein
MRFNPLKEDRVKAYEIVFADAIDEYIYSTLKLSEEEKE